MQNAGVIVWFPVLTMLFAMLVWWVILFLIGKGSKDIKAKISKYSLLGWGWTLFAALSAVFMVYKSITSPILRPTNEVAPKEVRQIVEAPEIPELKDLTIQAKPKDVLKEQPETPLVDKALKHLEEK